MAFQEMLKERRKQLNMSQSSLANKAQVTQSMVSKAEKGESLNLSTLEKLAKVLGLTLMVIPNESLMDVEAIALPSHLRGPTSLLERYGVSDDDD